MNSIKIILTFCSIFIAVSLVGVSVEAEEQTNDAVTGHNLVRATSGDDTTNPDTNTEDGLDGPPVLLPLGEVGAAESDGPNGDEGDNATVTGTDAAPATGVTAAAPGAPGVGTSPAEGAVTIDLSDAEIFSMLLDENNSTLGNFRYSRVDNILYHILNGKSKAYVLNEGFFLLRFNVQYYLVNATNERNVAISSVTLNSLKKSEAIKSIKLLEGIILRMGQPNF